MGNKRLMWDGGYNFKPTTKGHPRRIRRQHCVGCNTVLAIDMDGECQWIDKYSIWHMGRWFGNESKCPHCGREGRLPISKSLIQV